MRPDGSRNSDSQKASAKVALESMDTANWQTEFEEDLKNQIFEQGS